MPKALKLLIFLFLSCSIPFWVSGQNTGLIKGQVWDETSTLPGASVRIKNTSFGTITDINGNFNLVNLPPGKTFLVVSYMGYSTLELEIEVDSGQTIEAGKIVLKEAALEVNAVEVVSQRKNSEFKAINMQKRSSAAVNILAADGIGKLPDRNAAEALQRLPSVALEKSHGEGRYVSFRGTPNEWTSALINNDRLPVTDEEGKSRALPFDIIPSELIEYIIASKSLTPDIEGDAIGGSINFITREAPLFRTLVVNGGAGYNQLAQRPIFNGSILYGDRSKNNKFGFSVLGSNWYRNYATNSMQVAYASNLDHSLARLELRDYLGTRTTQSLNLAFDYKLTEKIEVYAKGLYSSFIDDKWLRKTMFTWATGTGSVIRLQTIHALLQTRLWGGETGSRFKINDKLTGKVRLASYDSKFEYGNYPFGKGTSGDRNGYHVVQFTRENTKYTDYTYYDEAGKVITDLEGENDPRIFQRKREISKEEGESGIIKPKFEGGNLTNEDFEFELAFTETNRTVERDPIIAQADFEYKVNNRVTLKSGVKLRDKTGSKRLSLHEWFANGAFLQGLPLTMDRYRVEPFDERGGFLKPLGQPYRGMHYSFLEKEAHRNFVRNFGDTLIERPLDTKSPRFPEWVGSQYQYQERVWAAYVLADADVNEKLKVNFGVRAEFTRLEMQADTLDLNEVDFDPNTGEAIFFVKPRNSDFSYPAILPMLNVRYGLNENTNLRLGITRTFRRPNFNESTPGAAVVKFADLIYDEGNAKLKPSFSWNFDLVAEYYFGEKGYLTGGVFYKYISDHIFATIKQEEARSFNQSASINIPGIAAKRYVNADPSFVAGLEIFLNRKFDFLPGKLKNTGFSGNLSLSYSQMQVPGRTFIQTLPRQTPLLYNLALFYEGSHITTRIALNYRAGFLYELNLSTYSFEGEQRLLHQNTDYDIYMNNSYSLDYLISFKIGKNLSLSGEANNLLNYPLILFRGTEKRPMKQEYYGRRGQISLKFSL